MCHVYFEVEGVLVKTAKGENTDEVRRQRTQMAEPESWLIPFFPPEMSVQRLWS